MPSVRPILCDASRKWRPNHYSYSYPQTQLKFEFGIVKLLDYENRWEELEASDNPFATVVMAHLKTQQTSQQLQERKTWKLSLIRRLYDLGWQEQDIRNLYRFIDWVMILPTELSEEFWEEFKQIEQERSMSYVTTGERIGYERGKQEGQVEGIQQGLQQGLQQGIQQGLQQGIQQGIQQGEQTLILKVLQKRMGELSQEVRSHIQSLSLTQLEALGEALDDFTAIEDLLFWLQANQSQ